MFVNGPGGFERSKLNQLLQDVQCTLYRYMPLFNSMRSGSKDGINIYGEANCLADELIDEIQQLYGKMKELENRTLAIKTANQTQ